MKPTAYIIHQSSGRTRLQVPVKRRDGDFFIQVHEQLTALPGVESVKTNPLSSSILLLHPESDPKTALEGIQTLGLFESIETQSKSQTPSLNPKLFTGVFNELEQAFSGYTKQQHTLLFVLLVGLAVVQMLRGNIMAPAIPLLGYAMEIALSEK